MPFVSYPNYPYRYPTLEPLVLSDEIIDEMRDVSKALYDIFTKVTRVFQRCPDEFMLQMDIPPKLMPYLRKISDVPAYISRFDYVLDRYNNLKMVEINADTPCAVVESYYGNNVAGDYYPKLSNPNLFEKEKLKKFLLNLYKNFNLKTFDSNNMKFSHKRPMVFACFDDYIEDKYTTLFLMNTLKEAIREEWNIGYNEEDVVFCSFYKLMVDDEGIVLPDGRHAGAIYRLHPLEILIEETADDGSSLGKYFLDGYMKNKFKMINPPECIIMQSKDFQALIWLLYQNDVNNSEKRFFTQKEMNTIRKHIIPSYFSIEDIPNNKRTLRYVKKPIWGREGSGISIITNIENDGDEKVEYEKIIDDESGIVQLKDNKSLYQEFIKSDSISLRTDGGLMTGYLTLSCFMLGNEPSAVYSRFSEDVIAGTEAFWAPVLTR